MSELAEKALAHLNEFETLSYQLFQRFSIVGAGKNDANRAMDQLSLTPNVSVRNETAEDIMNSIVTSYRNLECELNLRKYYDQ